MTALFVIGCIIVAFGIVLSFSLTFYVKIQDDVKIMVGAFGYKRLLEASEIEKIEETKETKDKILKKEAKKAAKVKRKKLAKLRKKRKKGKQEPGAAGELKAKIVTESTFGETVELVLALLKSSVFSTATLLRHVRISQLRLYMTVCGETADETAITYGEVSMGVYNLLAQLDHFMTLKVKSVDVIPDFVGDEEFYDIYFKVKLRLNCILGTAISIIFKFLVNIVKIKLNTGERTKK